MTPGELTTLIVEVLSGLQQESGRSDVEIVETTRPIGDLPRFDSLSGLEATVELADRLDCHIPEDTNLFINESGTRPLRVHQVAERLNRLLNSKITANGE